jgi:hypothetical protein
LKSNNTVSDQHISNDRLSLFAGSGAETASLSEICLMSREILIFRAQQKVLSDQPATQINTSPAPEDCSEVVQEIINAGDLLAGIGILNEFLDAKGAKKLINPMVSPRKAQDKITKLSVDQLEVLNEFSNGTQRRCIESNTTRSLREKGLIETVKISADRERDVITDAGREALAAAKP